MAAGCLIFVLMNACSWPWIPDFIPGTKASSESDKTAEEEPSGEDLEDEAVYVPREDLAIEDNGRFPIPVSLDVSSCALPVTNANEAVSALTDLSDLFDDPDLPEHDPERRRSVP